MPEMLAIHHLPQVFNPTRIFTDQQFAQILNRPDDRTRVPFQSRLTPTKQSRLIREHFDKNPIPHPSMTDLRFDTGDFHGGGEGILPLARLVSNAARSFGGP